MKQILKKALVIMCMAVAGLLGANAAELQEVVYLKNGSVIRGVILELVPEKSVKIQTSDGNIFVYQISEVQKITKEKPFKPENSSSETDRNYNYNYNGSDSYNYNYTYRHRHRNTCREEIKEEPYGWEKAPRYRGFVGLSPVIGVGDYQLSRVMIFTSHGVQLTPEIYIGLGAGVATWWDDDDLWEDDNDYTNVPLFANVRGELHKIFRKNFSPYLDIKTGYSFGDLDGFFFAPEVGCHFYFGHKKIGLGFGIGYHLHQAKITEFWWDYSNRIPLERWQTSRKILNGIALSVAFDF